MKKKQKGKIYIVGTPIGNLGDITLRALETLRKVDVVVAEDTRRTLKLLTYYQIKKPLISYHKHNERKRSSELIEMLKSGKDIAVVSDAGMPAISDPGGKITEKAWQEGIDVVVIPGVSAVTAALSICGFASTPYSFYGFPPAKGKERKKFFENLAQETKAIVLFESPARFKKTLKDILEYLENRNILVARELTKVHEEIFRGTVEDALHRWQSTPKGEITMIIEAEHIDKSTDNSCDTTGSKVRDELVKLLRNGFSTRDAVKEIASRYSISKSKVYQEALKLAGKHTDRN